MDELEVWPGDQYVFGCANEDRSTLSRNSCAQNATCPDCGQALPVQFALNQVSCSCGCIFCARCSAHYRVRPLPAAEAAEADQVQVAAPSCSCGWVDRAAVAAQWAGQAAVACWPEAPELQLLLLQLLQAHDDQVFPLLSRALLQRLQPDWQAAAAAAVQDGQSDWQAAAAAALSWDRVQAVDRAIQQQHDRAAAATEAGPDSPLQLIPAKAIPTFELNGLHHANHHAGGAAMEMELDQAPLAPTAAAAAAAAAKIAAAAGNARSNQQLAPMQVDGGQAVQQLSDHSQQQQQQQRAGAAWQQQQQQRAPALDLPPVPDAAGELADTLEGDELLALACDVAAAEQDHIEQQHLPPLPGPAAAALPAAVGGGGVEQQQQQQHLADGWVLQLPNDVAAAGGQRAVFEPDGQLGLEDNFMQHQEPEPMQADVVQIRVGVDYSHRQLLVDSGDAVRIGRGGPMHLATVGSSERGSAAAAAVPPELGFHEEAPPQLPDEPVVLIPDAQGNSELAFWQRT